MKRSFALSMAMVLALFSCETDPEVKDPLELSLNEIDKHHAILVDAYAALDETLTKEAILTCRKACSDQAEFMSIMYDKAHASFEKVLVNNMGQQAATDYFLKLGGVNGESKGKLIELVIQENATEAYVNSVGTQLKSKSSTVDTWYVFKELMLSNGETRELPTESISLNFTKIEMAVNLTDIILDLGLSETERTEALQEALDIAQIPPVAVGLLLPAIQKVREASHATQAEEMYLKWIEEEVTPTINGGLDRDIIRRKAFFEYLGGLTLIINEEYNNENQLGASIAILKARYDLKLLSLWADYWNLEPAG